MEGKVVMKEAKTELGTMREEGGAKSQGPRQTLVPGKGSETDSSSFQKDPTLLTP